MVQMRFNYLPIRRVYHGTGVLRELPELLKELGTRKVMVMSSSSVSKTVFYGDLLSEIPGDYAEFREVTQHSPMEEIEHATELMRNRNCDTILSVGGGSVQDAAKVVRYYYDIEAPQIAVPTTLSAAEFSHIAGYSIGGEKTGIRDARITPHYVFLDPEPAMETPQKLWRTSGIRALDHVIETVVSNFSSEPARIMAREAMRKIFINLHGDTLPEKHECQLAAWYSYFEVFDVPFGLSHLIGRVIGAKWEIPHGVTSCITLPAVLRHYAEVNPEPLALMGSWLGLSASDNRELALQFAKTVESFIRGLGFVPRLGDYGITRDDFKYIAGKIDAPGSEVLEVLEDMI
ncbi:MAG: iron-containing alcohol dehydrogenase [Thermoplasmataceae archaeon]|jgi:alcohol dehydrogenase class IV